MTYLVDQGESHVQFISDGSGALGSASIGTDNHSILVVGDILADVPHEQRLAVQVVDRDIEEALVLRIVEIHPAIISMCSRRKQ